MGATRSQRSTHPLSPPPLSPSAPFVSLRDSRDHPHVCTHATPVRREITRGICRSDKIIKTLILYCFTYEVLTFSLHRSRHLSSAHFKAAIGISMFLHEEVSHCSRYFSCAVKFIFREKYYSPIRLKRCRVKHNNRRAWNILFIYFIVFATIHSVAPAITNLQFVVKKNSDYADRSVNLLAFVLVISAVIIFCAFASYNYVFPFFTLWMVAYIFRIALSQTMSHWKINISLFLSYILLKAFHGISWKRNTRISIWELRV